MCLCVFSSPGWGMTLVAESTTGVLWSSEVVASDALLGRGADGSRAGGSSGEDVTLDAIGRKAAMLLLEEVAAGGVVDSAHQSTLLLLMILCPEDVSRARIGPLTPYTVESLRLYEKMFGVRFLLKPDAAPPQDDADNAATTTGEDGEEEAVELAPTRTIVAKCLGVGYKNQARRIA
jgi:RNA 3'-terminal phosphate cyclase